MHAKRLRKRAALLQLAFSTCKSLTKLSIGLALLLQELHDLCYVFSLHKSGLSTGPKIGSTSHTPLMTLSSSNVPRVLRVCNMCHASRLTAHHLQCTMCDRHASHSLQFHASRTKWHAASHTMAQQHLHANLGAKLGQTVNGLVNLLHLSD